MSLKGELRGERLSGQKIRRERPNPGISFEIDGAWPTNTPSDAEGITAARVFEKAKAGLERDFLERHTGRVATVCFSPDGKTRAIPRSP
jgi:putative hemolysin